MYSLCTHCPSSNSLLQILQVRYCRSASAVTYSGLSGKMNLCDRFKHCLSKQIKAQHQQLPTSEQSRKTTVWKSFWRLRVIRQYMALLLLRGVVWCEDMRKRTRYSQQLKFLSYQKILSVFWTKLMLVSSWFFNYLFPHRFQVLVEKKIIRG